MKQNKLILTALLLSLTTLFCTPVYAQNFIIDPEKEGKITITKYAVESLGDYNVPNTGEIQNIENLDTIPNIAFTLTRVQDSDTDPANATPIAEGQEGSYHKTLATNTNGIAVFDSLPLGVYLVHEEENPAVYAPVDDFLVSVPMTNPQGNGWLYDIYIYPKNQLTGTPSIQMFIENAGTTSAAVTIGATNTWIIQADIPKDIEQAHRFQIQGNLHPNLSLQPDSIQVYGATADTPTALTAEEDYTQEEAAPLDITITPQGKQKLATILTDNSNSSLFIEFQTNFTAPAENVEDLLGTALTSTATLLYTNALNMDFNSAAENPPYVYTGGLRVIKVDGKTETPLSGAKFKLYPSLDDARKNQNAIQLPGNTQDWEITTGENGIAFFYGLAYETQDNAPEEGTLYYLVETQAPDGYNLLPAPEAVSVSNVSHLENNAVKIEDYAGFTLPMTGGIGTFIFFALGFGLIGAAVFLFFGFNRKKRKP